LSGLTAHSSGWSFASYFVSLASVIMTSARPATISRKMVLLSACLMTVALLMFAVTNCSLVPPGLTITRTPGRSMPSRVWYLSLSAQRAIAALSSVRYGVLKYAFRALGSVTETPPNR
jgi:hypothetical protein